MLEADASTPVQTGAAVSEGTMSTLAEKLKARRAATASPSPAPEPVPVVAPPAPEPVVVPEPVAEPKVAKKAKTVPGPIGIIPPDAPGGELVPETAEEITPKVVEKVAVVEESIVVPEVKVEIVEPVVPAASPAAASAERADVSSAAELTLFIDAFPEKAPFDTLRALEDEIAARTPSLLEHLRKSSPKDVPEGTMDLGEVLFGRGYSALSASFAIKPITGAWTVSTLGPASSKVLEVLLPKATFVVRGRR
jgi:hypothetical protein